MRRWFEECNKGKTAFMAVFDELHAADIVAHGGTGEEVRGLKNFKEYCLEWLNAFPDLHFTVDDIVVEGDRVAVRSSWTGTFRHELKGIAPTDKKVTSWEIEIDRVANGKIAEIWTRYDTLSVMQQLGLAPTAKKES
jgi:predicted ester cyclase